MQHFAQVQTKKPIYRGICGIARQNTATKKKLPQKIQKLFKTQRNHTRNIFFKKHYMKTLDERMLADKDKV